MIDWAARAKAELASYPGEGADRTDEIPVSSVSSAPAEALRRNQPAPSPISSVSSATPAAPSANDDLRPGTTISTVRRSGNPYMTPEQGDECHEGCWNDAEIETFVTRSTRLSAMGRVDAEHLAARLTLRDRQADDRRLCIECRELESSGRCAAARRGALANTDRHLTPTQNILMRCPAFRGSDPHPR